VDSLQLISLINNHDKIWVDLGSGGGLPGLVIAIAQRDIESFHMHLIESQTRKAAFLQHCATLFDLPVTVYAKRIEVTLQKMTEINVLSARALTSLDALLEYASYCNRPPHKMLFLKGKGVDDELTQARKRWSFNHTIYPSHIDSSGCIVLIAGFDKL
jgi:16S rRNA (guanine527-N7)-methyltransferase